MIWELVLTIMWGVRHGRSGLWDGEYGLAGDGVVSGLGVLIVSLPLIPQHAYGSFGAQPVPDSEAGTLRVL